MDRRVTHVASQFEVVRDFTEPDEATLDLVDGDAEH
jgi:hypothetical protein